MENKERNILQIAHEYNDKLSAIQLPEMDVDDLLDLIDYYTRIGMDFEAEMYKRIAALKYPSHPDVVLMCAHWEADDGNWKGADAIASCSDNTAYDDALFAMEKALRKMDPQSAAEQMNHLDDLNFEDTYFDFLFDAAELFREFGYMSYAIDCLKKIPTTYPDYRQVLEILAECYYYQADYKNALLMLDQAIDKNAFDDYLWAQTALINYKNNAVEKALDSCEYSLAILKDNPRASQLKHLLQWINDETYPASEQLARLQDYASLMEIGDLKYKKGHFNAAEADYALAGYYCPRGNRDRVQITFKTACCQILLGKGRVGVDTLLSSTNQGIDLWPYALSLTQLLLDTHQENVVIALLAPLIKMQSPSLQVMEPIILLLSHYQCYLPVEALWRYILEQRNYFKPHFQKLLQEAEKQILPAESKD